jgi:protocatechuate 4,5-dioxygenase beta chain
MAQIVAILGMTHHPFFFRLTGLPAGEQPPFVPAWLEKGDGLRRLLREARADALVVVGNDHFHQFFMDNMPQFLIGRMEVFDGTFYNETREFGIPTFRIPGDPELAGQLLDGFLDCKVDLAFSNELKVDHSIVMPLRFVTPEMDIPIVPMLANCQAPPMPRAERFYEIGTLLRDVIERMPVSKRIAVITSAHFSLELGGPKQFGPTTADPAFDEEAIRWTRDGDVAAALAGCSFERLTAAGNVSHAFLTMLLAMGVARGSRPIYLETLPVLGTIEGFVAWDPRAGGGA